MAWTETSASPVWTNPIPTGTFAGLVPSEKAHLDAGVRLLWKLDFSNLIA
jgi:hypothetical protein